MSNVNWLEILGWGTDELDDLRFVGFSYIKQGLYDTAITIFEALAVLTQQNAYDMQTLGALYLQKGNNLMALSTIEKALKIAPHHAPTLLNRTKALFSLGYKNQAIAQARELQKDPQSLIASQASALLLAYT